MSFLKQMQLLEIENEELKKRLAKLTAPAPQPFYMQQWEHKDGLFNYMIFDVGGNLELTFTEKSPEKARAFFEQFKKTPPTVKTTIVRNAYSKGLFTSLRFIEQIVADVNTLTIKTYQYYAIYVSNASQEIKRAEDMSNKQAIYWYAQYVSDYLDNNMLSVEPKVPSTIFQ